MRSRSSRGAVDYFHELPSPQRHVYAVWPDNGSTIAYTDSTNSYTVDPDGRAGAAVHVQPADFNFKSLRGNAVLRWSTCRVLRCTSCGRRAARPSTTTATSARLVDAQDAQCAAENIFMIKATYWWNP